MTVTNKKRWAPRAFAVFSKCSHCMFSSLESADILRSRPVLGLSCPGTVLAFLTLSYSYKFTLCSHTIIYLSKQEPNPHVCKHEPPLLTVNCRLSLLTGCGEASQRSSTHLFSSLAYRHFQRRRTYGRNSAIS